MERSVMVLAFDYTILMFLSLPKFMLLREFFIDNSIKLFNKSIQIKTWYKY